tara:strand:+ start:871 stop:2538 length:1668 start_codon:yes stop_codon:yes gene_type:complete
MANYEYIKKRMSSMEGERQTWEDHWQQILDYVMPRKADITFQRSQGEARTEVLFDATAITANNLLAASLHGTLTSPSLQWFQLKLREDALNREREVQLWLEDSARKMYDLFNETNFNTEVHELYLDLCSIGTGALFVEEGKKGFDEDAIHFNTLHISEFYIKESINGKVDTLYRRYKLTARQAVQEFGEDNLGDKVIESLEKKPDKDFTFIHAVEPKEDYEKGTGETAETKLPFHSCHVCEEDQMVVRVSGYNEFPYLVPRWSKATGEVFGRSPSFNALPDIKTLNKAVEIGLKAWAKAIDPPLLVTDDGVIGRVRVTPGGITVVRGDGSVRPLQVATNWQITDMKENQLRAAIRQAYYSDQLQLQTGPQMTATEVQVRYELMQRLLGPTLGRFQSEFLNPLIERVFGIMLRNDAFLEVPEIIAGSKIDVEYVGPLARSQRMGESVAIDRLYQLVMQVAAIDPSIIDNINHDEAVRMRGQLLGVPKTILRSVDEVLAIRQQRAMAQQLQAQAMAEEQQAKTALTQSQAMKEMGKPETIEGFDKAEQRARDEGFIE